MLLIKQNPIIKRLTRLARNLIYLISFETSLFSLRIRLNRIIAKQGRRVEPSSKPQDIWSEINNVVPKNIHTCEISLNEPQSDYGCQTYWNRFQSLYKTIGCAREKALEHGLTFQLFNFSDVQNYCDVASAASPIDDVIEKNYPHVHLWKQDLLYETDLERKIIGGFAQDMHQIPNQFFDVMTLACSFEHFYGKADQEFVLEVDRILSAKGACLILPLYLDLDAKIFFDPTLVSEAQLSSYDSSARLCPTFYYRQEHGRYYSPQTLLERVLKKLPSTLKATLIRFTDPREDIYLRFGLVLHRVDSVFLFQKTRHS